MGERDAAAALRAAHSAAQQALLRSQEAERADARAKDDEQRAAEGATRHETLRGYAERCAAKADEDAARFMERRSAIDDEERPLLEEEVRLQQQRTALEEREQRHRKDFDSFSNKQHPAASSEQRCARYTYLAPRPAAASSARERSVTAPPLPLPRFPDPPIVRPPPMYYASTRA